MDSIVSRAKIAPFAATQRAMLRPVEIGLDWSPWVPFEGGDFRLLPRGPGLYCVRVVGQEALAYIGQTGRDLRARLADLRRNALAADMPFNDPHTAGPSLWAWRDAERCQFECSAASYGGDQRTRLALECWLLWQHRVVHGASCLCNYGRFHSAYVKSGDRRTGRRGGRRPDDAVNADAAAFTTALTRLGSPTDPDWMGLAWTPWASLRSLQGITGAGLYRIADGAGELLYIGESTALRARLGSHARHDWQVEIPMFSVATVPGTPAKFYLHELECDLIAGYFDELGEVPAFQFRHAGGLERRPSPG